MPKPESDVLDSNTSTSQDAGPDWPKSWELQEAEHRLKELGKEIPRGKAMYHPADEDRARDYFRDLYDKGYRLKPKIAYEWARQVQGWRRDSALSFQTIVAEFEKAIREREKIERREGKTAIKASEKTSRGKGNRIVEMALMHFAQRMHEVFRRY